MAERDELVSDDAGADGADAEQRLHALIEAARRRHASLKPLLESELADIEEFVGLAQAALAGTQEQAEFNRRASELERFLDDARAALRDSHEAAERAEAEAAAELERVRAEASHEVTRVLETSRAEIERLVAELADAERAREPLKQRLESLMSALHGARSHAEVSSRELRRLRAELEQAGPQREEVGREHEQRLELERRVNELGQSEQAARAALAQARAEVERERAERDNLRRRLRGMLPEAPAEHEQPPGAHAGPRSAPGSAPAPQPQHASPPQPASQPPPRTQPRPPSQPRPPIQPQPVAERGARRRRRFPWRAQAGPRTECAVCRRPAGSRGVDRLRAGGWSVGAGIVICARCRSQGWELDETARRPVRASTG